jgi:vesicle coat complex subunit
LESKLEKLLHNKGNNEQNKEKICRLGVNIIHYISDKEFMSRIFKELKQLNSKKTNNPSKSGQITCIVISPEKTYKWPTSTWKNVQDH